MQTVAALADPVAIDLRHLARRDRHVVVFDRLNALPLDGSLQLLNDHNPLGLRRQLDALADGEFAWHTLEAGPAVWLVQITRIAATGRAPMTSSCCSGGACCG